MIAYWYRVLPLLRQFGLKYATDILCWKQNGEVVKLLCARELLCFVLFFQLIFSINCNSLAGFP